MDTVWPRESLARRLLAILTLIALSFRGGVPSGYMVTPARTGGFAIIVCTGHGPVAARAGEAKGAGGKSAPTSSQDRSPCIYANLPAGLTTPDTPDIDAAPPALPRPVFSAATLPDRPPHRGLAAPPPPSQGPPALA